jgi:gamma-glutamylcyclotransferase (GGCT)/AIG2-like uncharacterized protein YtfP
MSPSHLFVYGTLMSHAVGAMGGRQRRRLSAEATVVGAGWVNGRLFDLGEYPGLLDGEQPDDIVFGEVVWLSEPRLSLEWLDAYEGVSPQSCQDDEYVRVERQAMLDGGRTVAAWVYVYRGIVDRHRRIANGRWLSQR